MPLATASIKMTHMTPNVQQGSTHLPNFLLYIEFQFSRYFYQFCRSTFFSIDNIKCLNFFICRKEMTFYSAIQYKYYYFLYTYVDCSRISSSTLGNLYRYDSDN